MIVPKPGCSNNCRAVHRADPEVFYNSWANAYSIQALVRLLDRHPDDEMRGRKIRELIAQQIDMLGRYEVVDGGWAYYDFEAHTRRPAGRRSVS